jgi:hypothetical protein
MSLVPGCTTRTDTLSLPLSHAGSHVRTLPLPAPSSVLCYTRPACLSRAACSRQSTQPIYIQTLSDSLRRQLETASASPALSLNPRRKPCCLLAGIIPESRLLPWQRRPALRGSLPAPYQRYICRALSLVVHVKRTHSQLIRRKPPIPCSPPTPARQNSTLTPMSSQRCQDAGPSLEACVVRLVAAVDSSADSFVRYFCNWNPSKDQSNRSIHVRALARSHLRNLTNVVQCRAPLGIAGSDGRDDTSFRGARSPQIASMRSSTPHVSNRGRWQHRNLMLCNCAPG